MVSLILFLAKALVVSLFRLPVYLLKLVHFIIHCRLISLSQTAAYRVMPPQPMAKAQLDN